VPKPRVRTLLSLKLRTLFDLGFEVFRHALIHGAPLFRSRAFPFPRLLPFSAIWPPGRCRVRPCPSAYRMPGRKEGSFLLFFFLRQWEAPSSQGFPQRLPYFTACPLLMLISAWFSTPFFTFFATLLRNTTPHQPPHSDDLSPFIVRTPHCFFSPARSSGDLLDLPHARVEPVFPHLPSFPVCFFGGW